MEIFKNHIVKLLKKSITMNENDISSILEIPPNPNFGDYSFHHVFGAHSWGDASYFSNFRASCRVDNTYSVTC